MEDRYAALFNDSLARCLRDESFLDKFYADFMAASPEIRDKFKDTDFVRQKRMLEKSLWAIMAASEANFESDEFLRGLADYHKKLAVKPEHFDIWQRCLINAASQCDPEFNAEIADAWRAVLRRGVELMKGEG